MKKFSFIKFSFFVLVVVFWNSGAAQTITMTQLTTGVAPSPLASNESNVAILGIQFDKAAGGMNGISDISIVLTQNPIGRFTNPRLVRSDNGNSFDAPDLGNEVGTPSLGALSIDFIGGITTFSGNSGAETRRFFVVVDIDNSATAATAPVTPSVSNTNVTATGTITAATITGTAYSFADAIAPTITFNPLGGATGVALASNITISFSEPIRNTNDSPIGAADLATLVELKLTSDAGGAVPFTASINGSNTLITIDPTSNLSSNTVYYVEINAVEDAENNAVSGNITFTSLDVDPPIPTFNPVDGTPGVDESLPITITFNEPIRKLNDSPITSGDLATLVELKLTNNAGASVPFTATINGPKTVITITPSSALAGTTLFYVEINPIEDNSDNAIVATNITFTTGDTLPPSILFNPTGGSVNFSAVGNIIITFNEPIRNIDDSPITPANIQASLVELKETNNGGTAVPFIATINGANTIITLNPTATLLHNQVYYIEVNPIEDGLDQATTAQNITFTTEDRPSVTGFLPVAGTCIGDNVRIQGSLFEGTGNPAIGNAPPTVTVNGVTIPAGNIVSHTAALIIFTLPAGVSTGPVTVRNNDSDLLSANSSNLTIFPAINISLPVTPATLNPAQNTSVAVQITGTQDSNYSYAMILNSGPGGYTATTQNTTGNSGNRTLTTTPNLSIVGDYTYRIDVSRTGCTTKTLINTPFTLTVASLAVNVSTTNSPSNQVCAGSSIQLIGAVSGGTGFYQFRWTSTPAGYSNSSSSPTVTPPANIVSYNLEVEDNAGNIVTGSVNITVNPVPSADIVPAPLEAAVRKNYTVENRNYQLYGSPAGGVFSGNGVSLLGDGNYYFNPQSATVGNHTITYVYTNGSGCSGQDTEIFEVTPSAINGLDVSYCQNTTTDSPLTPVTISGPAALGRILPGGYQFTRLIFYRQINTSPYTYCIAEVAPTFSSCGLPNPLTVNSYQTVSDIQAGVTLLPGTTLSQPVSYTINLDILRNNYGFSKDNFFYILAYGKDALGNETYRSFQPFEILANEASPTILGIKDGANICSDYSPSPITLTSSESAYTITGFSMAPGAFSSTLSGTNNRDFNPGHTSLLGTDERPLTITMSYNDRNNCPNSVIRKFNWIKKPDAPIAPDVQYCQVASPTAFTITGSPSGSADKPIWYEQVAPTIIIDSINWKLTAPGVSGTSPFIKTFLVQQQYKGCRSNTTAVDIEIKPAPDASFTPPSICDERDFTLTGPLDTNSGNAPYSTYDWSFGNSVTTSVASNNSVTYNYGTNTGGTPFTIGLQVTNSVGCQNTSTRAITVGINPKYVIDYKFICNGDDTEFKATITGNVTASEFEWNFGDGTIIPRGQAGNSEPGGGTIQNPIHKFLNPGEFTVSVTSYTALGCFNPMVKNVTILDYLTHSSANPYSMAAVDGGKGFWKLEDVNGNSTWEFAQATTPLKGLLTPAWVTNAIGDYNPSEKSFLNSPCLNILDVERPVLSMDLVVNTDKNKDGAVLEYSKDGGINWVQTGGVNSGINWFNTSGFGLGNIGSSPFGWSGDPWDLEDNPNRDTLVQARKALDNINNLSKADRAKIRFRIAFATDGNTEYEGIGFNNLTIDSRDRISLVENFTNQADAGYTANNNAFKNISGAETAKIQYHVGYPGNDLNYLANKADPSARAAYYGIALTDQLIPRGYIDGVSNGRFDQTSWVDNRFNKQALKNSPYSLSVDTQVPTDPSFVKISVAVKADANITANQKPILQIAVVEKTVSSNEFVLRKLVPSAAGTPLTVPIAKDAIINIVESVRIENAVDVTNLALVVFIQDEVTREVYQAAFNLTPTNLPTANVITGIEHIAEFIQLYPNPAHDSFVIDLPTKSDSRLSVHMIDQVGRVVHESSIETGEQSKTINTHDLAGGIYIVQIGAGKSGVVRKKMMIVHKN